MSKLMEHAIRELEAIGFPTPDSAEAEKLALEGEWYRDMPEGMGDAAYEFMLSRAVLEMMASFVKQRHSGTSAGITMEMFSKLADFKALSPLTNSPSEWEEVVPGFYQNKRQSSAFTQDPKFRHYYDIDILKSLTFVYWYGRLVPFFIRRRLGVYMKHPKMRTVNVMGAPDKA